MNKRIQDIYAQQRNVNMDRDHFNVNTRTDKSYDKHRIQYRNNMDANLVNMDRQMFNINTNEAFSFVDKNQSIADRQFHSFLTQNNLKNRQTNISHDNRMIGQNVRQNKTILKTEDNTFVKRMVNNNPYANSQIGARRIQTLDTKNNDNNKYKRNNDPTKFNPHLNYGINAQKK